MTSPTAPSTHAPWPAGERDLLRTVAAGTASVVGKAFFRSLVRSVAEALDADLAFAAELMDGPGGRARVIASWGPCGIEMAEGREFALSGSPCELTVERDVVALPEGAVRAYPRDRLIAEHGLDGYIAVVMRGSGGEQLGYLGVMSKRRLDAGEDEIVALRIFAARAAAEIERRRHEIALREREAEVAASRARVVHAADDERRRIGRNLHDGAQQSLVALGHLLDMARKSLEESPERAGALLDRARLDADAAFTELQELSRGLHPSALVQQGLGTALQTLATRSSTPVRIDALPSRRLPEVLEITVYYLVSEAVTNALKHAQASEIHIEVEHCGRVLMAAVSDDGVGGADSGGGSGLQGLADRAAALGGTLKVESPPGEGTRVRATIPLAPWRDQREPFLEFGHDGDDGYGERAIRAVLAGQKTASVGLAREWDLEGGPPRIGQRLPVRDQSGRRFGTVEVVRVAVVAFAEVDEDMVAAQAAGVSNVSEWRADRRSYYDGCRDEIAVLLGEPGWRFSDQEPMVMLWFRVAD